MGAAASVMGSKKALERRAWQVPRPWGREGRGKVWLGYGEGGEAGLES